MARFPESRPEPTFPAETIPQGQERQAPPDRPLLAISATFTAQPVEEVLRFWIRELGWQYVIRFAPYHQVFQQLLDPGSLLKTNRNGVDIILARLEDWSQFGGAPGSSGEALEDNVRHLVSGVRSASGLFHCPLIVCICPPSPGFLAQPGRAALHARMEAFCRTSFAELSGVHLIEPDELTRLYPVKDYYDPHGDELGHLPYTPEALAGIATALARKVRALRAAPYKAVVLDCDETLWQGVCAEDGPQGVCLDAGRKALQEFMVEQRASGKLLCLCSKNNEEDVLDTFRLNPGMPLRLEHFVARRINWESKSSNLASLAEELRLGLDSFIFVDDNPTECAEVQANCPEVLALPLPKNPRDIARFLRHVWAFDQLKATREDLTRTSLYVQEVERARLEKKTASLEEFLAALKLELRISSMTPEQIPRVAQLTQRTNQMNFTTVRRIENEIQELVGSGEAECLVVDVSDRFGSYGLVGVMLFRTRADALVLDTFLLSCRALGRGIEHRMLARLGEIAAERGIGAVEAAYLPTARNNPALIFLDSLGSRFREPIETGLLFRFPSTYLSGVAYKPEIPAPKPAAAGRREPSAGGGESIDFLRIASELRDPARILEQEMAGRCRAEWPQAVTGAPRTALEQELAGIWSKLLGVPCVGVEDDFFDLGGHSLLAVQLLSRVRQRFGVDLSLEIVYAGPFTVAQLAKAIDLSEIEQADAGEYAALLEELESLSDDEARALLAQEQDAGGNGDHSG
jgi:FkbH-like protein